MKKPEVLVNPSTRQGQSFDKQPRPSATGAMLRLVVIVVFLGFALAPATSAAMVPEPAEEPKPAEKTVQQWDNWVRSADEALQTGEPKRAIKLIDRIWRDCAQWALSGESLEQRFALGFVIQAAAHYQLGNEREAWWRFNAAIALLPQVKEWDLAEYGETYGAAESFLQQGTQQPAQKSGPPRAFGWPDIQKPKKRTTPSPRFAPRRSTTREGTLTVRFDVTREGLLKRPYIVQNSIPTTFAVAYLDAFSGWRFTPAKVDGVAVDFMFAHTTTMRW